VNTVTSVRVFLFSWNTAEPAAKCGRARAGEKKCSHGVHGVHGHTELIARNKGPNVEREIAR
jgi:hypothetical protein